MFSHVGLRNSRKSCAAPSIAPNRRVRAHHVT